MTVATQVAMHCSFYTLDPLIESSSWWHRRCLKRSRWQYKQNLRRPQRFPHIFLFQIYWSYINAWSKFKTNAGEHGLPVHHQTRRNASEALVWVSFARKANYFMYATLMLHLCVWILLDAFPSIGSSIQSSIPGGISSLCKPCGFSRLFSHLWWQGLLQAGEWWCPMKQIGWWPIGHLSLPIQYPSRRPATWVLRRQLLWESWKFVAIFCCCKSFKASSDSIINIQI